MNDVSKYFQFIERYNDALKKRGTNWLGPKDMGNVLLGVPLSETSDDERIINEGDENDV